MRPLVGKILAKKALQAVTFTATALAVVTTGVSSPETSVRSASASSEIQNTADSTGTVHWQSAFWALAAVALNTCLQESGAICEIEPKFGLLVKSSPVFCLVDAMIASGQILYYLKRVPPREALRIVATSRQQNSPNTQAELGSVSLIVGQWLLLVLAVLQGLKLYALRGIPWTQAFGTMYLISYATNAVLNVTGNSRVNVEAEIEREDIRPSVKVVHCLAMASACLQVTIWTFIIRAALSDHWLATLLRERCSWLVGIVTLILFSPFFLYYIILLWGTILVDLSILIIPSVVMLFITKILLDRFLPSLLNIVADGFGCAVQTFCYTFASSFIFVAIVVQICLFGRYSTVLALFSDNGTLGALLPFEYIKKEWDICMLYSSSLLILALATIVSYFLHRLFFIGSLARKLKARSLGLSSSLAWACLFMFLANLLLSLLYYSYVYSSDGTSKPSWTDNLGRMFM